jgi:hypothetical protein
VTAEPHPAEPIEPAPRAARRLPLSTTAVVLVAVLAVGFVLALALLVAGARAGGGQGSGGAAPNVVGMPVARAQALLRDAGARKIAVVRVPYGELGIVQRATGFEFDGTVNSGSTLKLLVGTRRLNSWSQTQIP